MATVFISTALTTTQTFGHDDDVLVSPTGSVFVSGSAGIKADGLDHSVNVTLLGDVVARNWAIAFSGTASGANVESGLGDYRVFVGAGVTVANINDFQDAILIFGSDNHLENLGTITSGGASAVSLRGTDATIINHGEVLGRTYGLNLDGQAAGGRYDITNTGMISGDEGIYESGFGGSLQLDNSGTITGTAGDGVDWDGQAGGDDIIINNSGTISSQGDGLDYAIRAAGDSLILNNSGALIGAVNSSSAGDVVTNSGRIIGFVTMGSGDDVFDGRGGTVTDPIFLGDDNDTAILDDANATVDGGAGDDTVTTYDDLLNVSDVEVIRVRGQGDFAVTDDDTATLIDGNTGANEIDGAGGNDTLRGRLGDDLVSGGDDDDLIIGNAGNDELTGDNGLDTLFGGQGDDELFGGFGTDELFGGAGDDTINPGGAQDTMSGGAGADVFLFESATDAGSGSSADRIDGFVRGVDVIDLVALGTTPASFIGTSGFSGGGNMEVRYTVNGFGNALVRIDEDGNGTEDARIVVAQTAMLDAGDFLL